MDTPTTKRLRNAILALGWNYPFFLPALAMADIVEDTTIKTMTINEAGLMRVNPGFAASLSDKELAAVGVHELGHPMLAHLSRMGSRNLKRWNRAIDRAWNQALREMGIELPAGAIYPERGNVQATAEELYDLERVQPEDDGAPGQGKEPAPGQGCGAEPGQGRQEGSEGDGEGEGQGRGESPTQSQMERQWAEVANQARALAAGTQHADVMARITNVPRPRVRWENLIKSAASHALAAHGRDDQTWNRRSRRSPADGYLPGWTATRAKIAVAIDSSGSITDEMLAGAIGHAVKLAQISGLKLFLALHDTDCYWSGWIAAGANPEGLKRHLTGRGGTYFRPTYQTVEGAGRFDVFVHLTDGYGETPWPGTPRTVRRLIVAQLGDGKIAPPVGTQIVPTEL